jgi:translocation and assembly module TamB
VNDIDRKRESDGAPPGEFQGEWRPGGDEPPPHRRGLRVLGWLGIAFGALLLIVVGLVLWILNTESGTRWAAARAVGFMDGKLELRQVNGTIAGPLTVDGIRWYDVKSGVDVHVARVSLDVAIRELFSKVVHVQMLDVNGVDVRLFEHPPKPEEPSTFSLKPPLDFVLDRLTLKDARVAKDGKELFVARTAEAIGSWTSVGAAIRKFEIDSPDGNVHLTGDVAESAPSKYVGRATGGFRWKVGDLQYAGDLAATSENEKLNLGLRLGSPLTARLDATLGETDALPWTFNLSVPKFDPREKLMPGSSLESLAATLRGQGDLTVAEVRGDTTINGQQLRIDPARVRYKENILTIETVRLIDPTGRGTLTAAGDLRFGPAAAVAAQQRGGPEHSTEARPAGAPTAQERGSERSSSAPVAQEREGERSSNAPAAPDRESERSSSATTAPSEAAASSGAHPADESNTPPLFANLNVQWKDIELPKEWVGQPLGSHGQIKVVGSTTTFSADGQLALGPPGHLADIALSINGTPEQIQVEQIAVTEKTGNLTAHGTVNLKPRIGWQFAAHARRFDPGQIIAGWPGRLDFALDTKGQLTDAGPDASLNLKDLRGSLRGRTLSGQAALTLNPQKVIAGTLNLRSGKSSLGLTGRGGKTMDVDTQFDIASLDDWLPKSAGRLNGKFHISGSWPVLAIEGGAQARALAFGEYSAKSIDVTADMKNPQSPEGSLKVTATEIIAAGFTFSQTELTASGNEKDHSVRLDATGQPLSTQFRIHGARNGDSWSGTVDQLTLAAVGLEPLSLRAPAKVNWSPRGFDVSESCLAGEHISACASANQSETGELNAKYRLEHLPLGLIAALAVPDLPMRIEAVIEGDGNIRRTPEGELFGRAQITSTSGRITDAAAAAQEDAADALLTYENLRLEAQLAGDTANGSIQSNIGPGGGSVEGKVALANLRGSSPSLNGEARLSLPDLSPAGLFVPQLSAVKGRAEATVQISGTAADPKIVGNAALRELAADVPQVGIKLHDGEVTAALAEGNSVTLNGRISSGDGQITLTGNTNASGVLNVKVQGKDFVAANIPGAKVFVEPDLDFERSKEKMTLGGKVTIPKADIDLTKLPKQGASVQHASPDVVVIDDKNAEIAKSRSVPLEAHVTVILGKDVNLVGYGLTSKVEGQLVVHELPEEETKANGEVRVSGKYKAYGQDLTIEQGRLLYAGQAITDPQINLIATRTVDTVTAKLIVSGTANKPLLEVTSDPPLPQTQALSYLVAGKPLNEVGSGEGDMVQSAARSLGGAAGNLLAKGLGKRLGIDQVGIEDTPEAGGSAFTVGQYLSPRLYLSYGVGLFEPGQVVTLRYRLSSKVSLEAVQGSISQRAGINYRVEK